MKIAICLFLSIVALNASASVYEQSFRYFGTSDDYRDCVSRIEVVAKAFESKIDGQLLDSSCRANESFKNLLDGVLVYESENRPDIVSTYVFPLYSTFFYRTKQDCTDALDIQSERFLDNTGLEPIASYCMKSPSTSSWSTRIDAIGATSIVIDNARIGISRYQIDLGNLAKDLLTMAEFFGVSIAEIGVAKSGIIDRDIVARTYSNQRFDLNDYDKMQFSSKRECKSALSELGSLLSSAAIQPTIFCEQINGRDKHRLHIAIFAPFTKANTIFKATELGTSYSDLQTCKQATKGRASASIFGGVCGGESGKYKVFLFSKP